MMDEDQSLGLFLVLASGWKWGGLRSERSVEKMGH